MEAVTMKKVICVLLAALLMFSTLSVGFACFAADPADGTTEVTHAKSDSEAPIDLTKEGGNDHTTFWRIFCQMWIEVYYFFVDIVNMVKAL